MRKIISILVALGLVLAFSVVAVPSAGAACGAKVTVVPTCAGSEAVYTVNLTAPVTLQPGDLLSFKFGNGTTFGTFADNDVTVDGHGVLKAKVTGTAPNMNVEIPAAAGTIYIGTSFLVVIPHIVNPAVGTYSLGLDYKQACCAPVDFDCATYTITPKTSVYDFFWDSSPTYAGLPVGFIPPFKACGQDGFPGAFQMPGGGIANAFNLILKPTLVGCDGPCNGKNITITLWLSAAPSATAKVSLGLNNLTGITHTLTLATTNVTNPVVVGNVTLGNNTTITWTNIIHFDTIGDYIICVKAWCPPGAASCETGCSPTGFEVASECFPIKVYQWKDACKIPLARKWNLISLPLVPLAATTPAALLNAYYYKSEVVSVWYFDQNTDKWLVYPAGTAGGDAELTTIEDGKAYWIRIKYDVANPAGQALDGVWVWGTAKPVPPKSPSAYPVYLGWNMVGFTEGCGASMAPGAYLWNFLNPLGVTFGAVCGWNAATQTWDPIPPANMLAGKGYWVPFSGAGTIYPP